MTWTNIPWDKIDEVNIKEGDRYSTLHIDFKQPIQYKVEGLKGSPIEIKEDMEVLLNVSKEKAESCKKAVLRLAEIVKEENKDPFANN